MSETSKLQKNTVVLDVRFRRPGSTRKASKDGIDFGADKDVMKLSKQIFDSEHFKKTVKLEQTLKASAINPVKLESPFREGTYLIPVTCLDGVYQALEKCKEEYDEAADKFVADWDEIKENAKKRLRDQYRAGDYPTARAVRAKFGVDYQLLSFDTPEESKLGEVLYKQELEKARDTWKQAEQDVVVALRVSMAELVNHLVESLSPKADGSKPRLFNSAIDKVTEFLDNFSKRNIMDDEEMQVLVEKAKRVLKGKDAEAFRSNEDVRIVTSGQLKKVAKELDKLITTSKRKMSFEDE